MLKAQKRASIGFLYLGKQQSNIHKGLFTSQLKCMQIVALNEDKLLQQSATMTKMGKTRGTNRRPNTGQHESEIINLKWYSAQNLFRYKTFTPCWLSGRRALFEVWPEERRRGEKRKRQPWFLTPQLFRLC